MKLNRFIEISFSGIALTGLLFIVVGLYTDRTLSGIGAILLITPGIIKLWFESFKADMRGDVKFYQSVKRFLKDE